MLTHHFRNMIVIFVGLISTAGFGDELTDLITRLQKLEANSPLHAAVHIEERTFEPEEKKGASKIEKVDLVITSDAHTLTLCVKGDISNAGVFEEFSLLRARELVHYGPSLARELKGLKRIQKVTEPYNQIPCTRWLLRAEETRKQFGMSATLRREVDLWIDAEGFPVAALFKKKGESKMLLFRQHRESTHEQRFEKIADRLILIFDKQDDLIKQSKSKDGKRIVTTIVEVKKSLP